MLIDALVTDALGLLEVLVGWDLDGPAADAVALLALIAGQDVEPADGSDGADGNRRLRYRGMEKNIAWLRNRTAALNLRKLLNLGLILNEGTWALA